VNHLNLTMTGPGTIDLVPIRTLKTSQPKTEEQTTRRTISALNEPFTARYFKELVFGVSSGQLGKVGQSLVNKIEEFNTLDVFVVDVVQPEDHVDLILFEREKSTFTRLLPTLMPRYAGQFVAVHDGDVVDSDRSSSELVRRFFRQFGDTHVYIGYVGQEEPVSYSVSPFNF